MDSSQIPLYSVFLSAGKPRTIHRAQNSVRNLKLAALGGVIKSQTLAIEGSFVFREDVILCAYYNHKILMYRHLSHFYLFTMLLFICLWINPCVCVTHCAFREFPTCICV